jgi:hypothetical protein
MDWMSMGNQLFQLVAIPVLLILSAVLVSFIHTKTKEAKDKTDNETAHEYLYMLDKTITECVIATTQTYVDAMKGKNAFDSEAQKTALQKTYDNVMSILTADAVEYLQLSMGNLTTYIYNKIESEVRLNKNN